MGVTPARATLEARYLLQRMEGERGGVRGLGLSILWLAQKPHLRKGIWMGYSMIKNISRGVQFCNPVSTLLRVPS